MYLNEELTLVHHHDAMPFLYILDKLDLAKVVEDHEMSLDGTIRSISYYVVRTRLISP